MLLKEMFVKILTHPGLTLKVLCMCNMQMFNFIFKGYQLVGSKLLMCSHRNWQGHLPVCKSSLANCELSNINTYEHSYHSLAGDDSRSGVDSQYVLHGSVLKYYCYSGYVMKNPDNSPDETLIRTCDNGLWLGPEPVCGMCLYPHQYYSDDTSVEKISPTLF